METSKGNEYTTCFKYIIFVMKMFAVFPFFPLHEIMDISHLFSMIFTIISVSLFGLISIEEVTHLYYSFLHLLENFGFVPLLAFIPGAVIKFLLLCGPLFTWNKNEPLKNYRDNWQRFQIEMEKLTRSPFKCSVKDKIQGIFTIGMVCMSGIALLIKSRQWSERIHSPGLLSALYTINGSANMMTYWVVNNMYTISSTKKIIKLVRRSINKDRDMDLRRLIDLWITICDLNEQFIKSHSIIFLFLFCSTVISGIVGAFSTVLLFAISPDTTLGYTYLIGTGICLLGVMTFCESANSVTKYMVYKLRRILLSENVNNKNKKLLQMIVLFLQTIETKNPQISFNGYMTLDRSIVSSVLGTAVYFLVVLKQFSPE